MAEKDHEKHAFTYMDGIPVKISERYKPPRRIVLPVGFQNRLLPTRVPPSYDFELERSILGKLEQWQQLRQSEKEKRRQQLQAEDDRLQQAREAAEEARKKANETSAGDKPSVEKTPSPTSPPEAPPATNQQSVAPNLAGEQTVYLPTTESNSMLRPIPINHHISIPHTSNSKPISAFNLSDFEADTSSPFDNMELKTINDLEELAQVLQPSTNNQAQGFGSQTSERSASPSRNTYAGAAEFSLKEIYQPPFNMKTYSETKSSDSNSQHLNGITSVYGAYNSMQTGNYSPHHSQSVKPSISASEQVVPYNVHQINSLPYTYSQDGHRNMYNFYTNNAWPTTSVHSNPDSCTHGLVVDNIGDMAGNTILPTCSSDDQSAESSPSSTPGAVDSIVQQLSELMKSRTSKPLPLSPNGSLTEDSAASEKNTTLPCLNDPFITLHPDSQVLVQKIAEMGFPRPRVARACQTVGGNDKKMVEYLLSLESLLDAGHPEHQAEHALSVNNLDLNAASHFLQVQSQLLDLGFSEEQVSEALLKFSCDRDKALDFLLS